MDGKLTLIFANSLTTEDINIFRNQNFNISTSKEEINSHQISRVWLKKSTHHAH